MKIVGKWVLENGEMKRDKAEEKISDLLEQHLSLVATTEDGWTMIYRDQRDGQTFELTYVDSSSHGGRPRQLRSISEKEVKQILAVKKAFNSR